MADNIAIVGGAPSADSAPYDDPDWEIWSITAGFAKIAENHCHRWFELHSRATLEGRKDKLSPEFIIWLEKDEGRAPVYIMPDSGFDEVPNTVMYPRAEMRERFGDHWWSSSLAWMTALALEERKGKIGLFGVEMCAEGEYEDQIDGLIHFLDIARLTGRDVIFAQGCNLLRPSPIYPFKDTSDGYKHAWREMDRLKGEKASLDAQAEAMKAQSKYCEGAIDVYDHLIRNNWL